MFAYTVHCQHTDEKTHQAWCRWMLDEHLADVCAAGALSAELIVDGLRCETRYAFADRAAFETYEREHAPRLREEGLARFPLSLGLSYSRTTGERMALVMK